MKDLAAKVSEAFANEIKLGMRPAQPLDSLLVQGSQIMTLF